MKSIYKLSFLISNAKETRIIRALFVAESDHADALIKSQTEIRFPDGAAGPLEDDDLEIVTSLGSDIEVIERLKLEYGPNPIECYLRVTERGREVWAK